MASAHDAILDAAPLQVLATLFAVIGFVGIDDLLVAADELFGGLALVDIGRRDNKTADDPALLIHSGMNLVAEVILAFLLRPCGIGIVFAPDKLARRTSAVVGRQRSIGPFGCVDRSGHQRNMINVPCLTANPDTSICLPISSNNISLSSGPRLSRKRHSVEWSGTFSESGKPVNSRNDSRSFRASSIAGSDRLYQRCRSKALNSISAGYGRRAHGSAPQFREQHSNRRPVDQRRDPLQHRVTSGRLRPQSHRQSSTDRPCVPTLPSPAIQPRQRESRMPTYAKPSHEAGDDAEDWPLSTSNDKTP